MDEGVRADDEGVRADDEGPVVVGPIEALAHGGAASPQQPPPKRRKTAGNHEDDTDEDTDSSDDSALQRQMEADVQDEDEDDLNLQLEATITGETAAEPPSYETPDIIQFNKRQAENAPQTPASSQTRVLDFNDF